MWWILNYLCWQTIISFRFYWWIISLFSDLPFIFPTLPNQIFILCISSEYRRNIYSYSWSYSIPWCHIYQLFAMNMMTSCIFATMRPWLQLLLLVLAYGTNLHKLVRDLTQNLTIIYPHFYIDVRVKNCLCLNALNFHLIAESAAVSEIKPICCHRICEAEPLSRDYSWVSFGKYIANNNTLLFITLSYGYMARWNK